VSGDTIIKAIDSGTLAALEERVTAIAWLIGIDTVPAMYYTSPGMYPIVEGGKTYEPRWFEIETLRWGAINKAGCTVVIDNRDDAISDASYTSRLSDGYTLTVGLLAKTEWAADWEAVYTPWSGLISQVSGNGDAVRISAAADVGMNWRAANPPMNLYCPYVRDGAFKGLRCAYAGAGTSCDGSWAQCTTYSNTVRFGGHRFAPKPGQVWRISVNQGYQHFPSHPQGGNPPPDQDTGGRDYVTDPFDNPDVTDGDAGSGRGPLPVQGRL
jgi:hypothetical protein